MPIELLGHEHLFSAWDRSIPATECPASQRERQTKGFESSAIQKVRSPNWSAFSILEIQDFVESNDAAISHLSWDQCLRRHSGNSIVALEK